MAALRMIGLLLLSNEAIADARPNIVLMMAEDLSSRIGAFGDSVAVTPNIDRLANEGVRYTNVFTTAGVCAPSRAATIMGAHAISFGAQHMRTSGKNYKTVPPPDMKAYPELLRKQGYYTLTDGKLDYQFSGTMSGSGPFTIWDKEGRKVGIKDAPIHQPFFAQLNFMVTHESGIFPPLGNWPHSITHFIMQVLRPFMGRTSKPVESINAENISIEPYYPDTPTVRQDILRHYHNITAMDAEVGSVLSYLSETGLDDNTIVIWTTDHGDGLPRAKRELYDSGIKVPMIIRWPERFRPRHIMPGSMDSQLISFVDLAPTIMAMAQIQPTVKNSHTGEKSSSRSEGRFQGRDIIGATAKRHYVFASRDRIDEVPDRQRAIRDARFKYIRSYHPNQEGGHRLNFRENIPMVREMFELLLAGKLNKDQQLWFQAPGEERLFDLKNDPHELRNIVEDPDYKADLVRLRTALDERLSEIGDLSGQSENEMRDSFLVSGEQGLTAAPKLSVDDAAVTLTSIDSASIGYRINSGDWQLYTQALMLQEDDKLDAKAQRYGWLESKIVSWEY
ncbi:MAG: sulfatase [Pseudomonadales bacterium]